MPPRSVCLAILLYWVVAASNLIRYDLLPELRFVSRPPDLLSIARAVRGGGPSSWSVQVIDDPAHPEARRTVGQAVTESVHRHDGWVLMSSRVRFDSGGLLRGTAFATRAHVELEISSTCHIDPTGNLHSFKASVRSQDDPREVLRVEGRLNARRDALEVVSQGPLPIMNQTRTVPYQPRSMVQNSLEPFDYLPGLQVGQRWESRVVNPLTSRIEPVKVEVARKTVVHWDGKPVTALEVVQHLTPFAAKTWVRTDGLVIRQEVPFPLVKLVLERLPEGERGPGQERLLHPSPLSEVPMVPMVPVR
jgi:hypothetical protein